MQRCQCVVYVLKATHMYHAFPYNFIFFGDIFCLVLLCTSRGPYCFIIVMDSVLASRVSANPGLSKNINLLQTTFLYLVILYSDLSYLSALLSYITKLCFTKFNINSYSSGFLTVREIKESNFQRCTILF